MSRKAFFVAAAVSIGAGLFSVPASADTIDVFDLSGFASTCSNGLSCPGGLTFSGTITINVTTGTITAVDLAASVVSPPDFTTLFTSPTSGTSIIATQPSTSEGIALQGPGGSTLISSLHSPPSLINASAFLLASIVSGPVLASASATLTLETPTAVPLPAALPLFATGLGALGLLGWRRKRKAA
jgi:hypothetical protein